jgi:hypothetical protein
LAIQKARIKRGQFLTQKITVTILSLEKIFVTIKLKNREKRVLKLPAQTAFFP